MLYFFTLSLSNYLFLSDFRELAMVGPENNEREGYLSAISEIEYSWGNINF
jgi:hypothetical protein